MTSGDLCATCKAFFDESPICALIARDENRQHIMHWKCREHVLTVNNEVFQGLRTFRFEKP